MKKQNKTISVEVNNLIALCNILNDYTKFTQNLKELIKNNNSRNIAFILYKISKGEFVFSSRKEKKFYKDNKSVIDTINKYSNIQNITINYLTEENSLDFFYKYIKKHQDNLERILSVLEKIEELGFDKLEFDEENDFTNTIYEIDTRSYINDISYLDNIEIVPNYENNIVEYKTTGSNYKIDVHLRFNKIQEYKYRKTIIVNSLLFDPKRLPEEITEETIYDKIVSLKKKEQESCNKIRSSVDLSISIDDLYTQFENINKIIEQLNNEENKEQLPELRELLLEFKNNLNQLQKISSEYNERIIKENPNITKEMLKKEKKKYLKRRDWASIDID